MNRREIPAFRSLSRESSTMMISGARYGDPQQQSLDPARQGELWKVAHAPSLSIGLAWLGPFIDEYFLAPGTLEFQDLDDGDGPALVDGPVLVSPGSPAES